MTIFKLESKNLVKNKANFFLILALVGIFLIPFFLPQQEIDYELYDMEYSLEVNQQTIENLKNEPKAVEVINDLEATNLLILDVIHALKDGNPQSIVGAKYNFEKRTLEDLLAGKIVGIPIIAQQKKVTLLEELRIKEYPYINLFSPWNLQLSNYFEYLFSGGVPSIIFLALSVVLIGSIVTYEKRKKTIDLISTSPDNLLKKHFSRFIAYFLFVVASVFLSLLFISVIVLFKNGFGLIDYPVVIIQGGEIVLLTMLEFLGRNLLLLLFWLLFLTSLSFFINLFSSNYLINLGILALFIFISNFGIMDNLSNNKLIINNSPGSYVEFQQVVLGGSLFYEILSPNITFYRGIVVLGSFSTLIILATFLVILKKKRY